MQTVMNPRYTFSFAGSDGGRYRKQVYWDALYVFSDADEPVLAAARVVPHSDLQYALYMALKGKNRVSLSQRLLQDASLKLLPAPSLKDEGPQAEIVALVKNLSEVLPDLPSSIPLDILRESERRLEESISGAMVQSGIEEGLGLFSDPTGLQAAERRLGRPESILHILADLDGKDLVWVSLSFRVDEVVKGEMWKALEANATTHALAPADFVFDLSKRLYSNPKYLAFVRQVLDAKGSFVSPVVRDFLWFYTRCLRAKLEEYAQQERVDSSILEKRLESLLGSERGPTHFYRDYYDVTILGRVLSGQLWRDSRDPDAVGESFRVHSEIDPGDLLLREIEGPLQKYLVRFWVRQTFNRHHNVESVHYMDET